MAFSRLGSDLAVVTDWLLELDDVFCFLFFLYCLVLLDIFLQVDKIPRQLEQLWRKFQDLLVNIFGLNLLG